ncbi:MAG: nucleotide sugar dehydrogenase [Planctomycetota bacterium]
MDAAAEQLRSRIADRSVTVAVIGLGYVGLPLASAFAHAGVRTLGVDIDPGKPEAIEAGRDYLPHLGEGFAARLRDTGRFIATTDFGVLREAGAVLICVPTPLGPHREPDLSYVLDTAGRVAESLDPDRAALVVLESTTYPGTTRDLLLPALQAGDRAGRLLVAYSPERENPGGDMTTGEIPRLVGGLDQDATDLACALYRLAIERVLPVASPEVAEAAKLLENVYRSVNIALVNEMKLILEPMGINVHEVIEAAATKPFGFQRFDPGPGLGGHCIPIDPYYLAWKARGMGIPARFIELAGQINHDMPGHVVGRVVRALNDRRVALPDARVLVLGLAYKKDVADVRESPALEIITRLRELGAAVEYHDPLIPRTHRMRRYDLGMASIELTDAALEQADAVVIATDHSSYDWQRVADHARLVIDTRNALRDVTGPREHIVLA